MFEKFNLIQYSLTHDGKKLTDYILTDLTTRTRLRADENILVKFRLRAGDTPESVSQELYNTPYYHWVVMNVNNIFDVHNEWYLADDQLYEYCQKKYDLNYVILNTAVNTTTDTFTVVGHKLKPNDKVTLSSDDLPGGLYENIVYYIYNTTDDTFQLTSNLNGTGGIVGGEYVSESIIDVTSQGTAKITINCNRSDVPAYWVDEQDNIMSTALDLYEGWSNNEDTRISYKNAMNDIIASSASRTQYLPATNKTITEVETDVIDVVEASTPIDQVRAPTYRTLTNFQYEEMMNARKQYIYVIRPEYIKKFIDQFNEAVAA